MKYPHKITIYLDNQVVTLWISDVAADDLEAPDKRNGRDMKLHALTLRDYGSKALRHETGMFTFPTSRLLGINLERNAHRIVYSGII